MRKTQLYIGGEWVVPIESNYKVIKTTYESKPTVKLAMFGEKDFSIAIQKAKIVQKKWMETSLNTRINILSNALNYLKDSKEELIKTICDEIAQPYDWVEKVQINYYLDSFERFLKEASQLKFEQRIDNSIVKYIPYGVVLAITPWNYPLGQAIQKMIPALVTGNVVILHPSQYASLSSIVLFKALEKAKIPAGVCQLITGDGNLIGKQLKNNDIIKNIDMISFTGSTKVGREINKIASTEFIKVTLELGGKNPAIALPDAKEDKVVDYVLNDCFMNSGQTCSAVTRLFIPKDKEYVYKAILKEKTKKYKAGNPFNGFKLGPIINSRQFNRIVDILKNAEKDINIETISGGIDCITSKERIIQPTIYFNVNPNSNLSKEEIFGPVLSVTLYENIEDAVMMANNTDYGLSSVIFGNKDVLSIAKNLESGQILINGAQPNTGVPFGGLKYSGQGHEGGVYGLMEFLNLKSFVFEK